MRITGYDIELIRMETEHLEMVRQWRNAAFVQRRMQFRQPIEPGEQTAWFQTLHPDRDWYFVAEAHKQPFGVFHIKNIDPETRTGEAGAFVGQPEHMESILPALAILRMMEFAFDELGLERLEAKYHPDFQEVVRLNEQMGYQTFLEETDGFVRAAVTKARFFEQAARFRKAALKWAEINLMK
jgi:RimJ/RimL family protein N-acetyltransferase